MDFITTQIQDGSQKWRSPDTSEKSLFIDRERAISFTESEFFHSNLTLMTIF